jgi:hypothetical protein
MCMLCMIGKVFVVSILSVILFQDNLVYILQRQIIHAPQLSNLQSVNELWILPVRQIQPPTRVSMHSVYACDRASTYS